MAEVVVAREQVPPKELTRRDFLRTGGMAAAGAGGLLLGAAPVKAAAARAVKYAMVINLDRCYGCRACMEACKVENNTPAAVFWNHVFRLEEGHYPNVRVKNLPRPCMHCDNAPCVKVCPVGARYKRTDGLVLTDFERCIGCRYCVVSCPYSVNYFNWNDPKTNQYYDWNATALRQVTTGNGLPYRNPDHDKRYGEEQKLVSGGNHFKGIVGKCTFCVHRLEKGLLPACVANCPVEVYTFGDLNDPNSAVSRILKQKPSFRLAEELGTEPRVYYVGSSPVKIDSNQLDAIMRRV